MRDTPPPDLAYKTKTKNQFNAKTVDDCVWYAVNDAYEYVTRGVHQVASPEAFRRASSGTISGPSKLSDVLSAFAKRFPFGVNYDQSPVSASWNREACITALTRGACLVFVGDYEKLPKYYRRWTNNDIFDHAVNAKTFRRDVKLYTGSMGSTWFYDPLGGGTNDREYEGEWIAIESLTDEFAWKIGSNIAVAFIDTYTEEDMFTVSKGQTTTRIARVKAGTKLMKMPEASSGVAKTLKNEQNLPLLGVVNSKWSIVISDIPNLNAPKGVYVHQTDILKIESIPAPATDEQLVQENVALLKENDQLSAKNVELQARVDKANAHLGKIDKEAVQV
jgi:hypothetical protein